MSEATTEKRKFMSTRRIENMTGIPKRTLDTWMEESQHYATGFINEESGEVYIDLNRALVNHIWNYGPKVGTRPLKEEGLDEFLDKIIEFAPDDIDDLKERVIKELTHELSTNSEGREEACFTNAVKNKKIDWEEWKEQDEGEEEVPRHISENGDSEKPVQEVEEEIEAFKEEKEDSPHQNKDDSSSPFMDRSCVILSIYNGRAMMAVFQPDLKTDS